MRVLTKQMFSNYETVSLEEFKNWFEVTTGDFLYRIGTTDHHMVGILGVSAPERATFMCTNTLVTEVLPEDWTVAHYWSFKSKKPLIIARLNSRGDVQLYPMPVGI